MLHLVLKPSTGGRSAKSLLGLCLLSLDPNQKGFRCFKFQHAMFSIYTALWNKAILDEGHASQIELKESHNGHVLNEKV